MLTTKLGEIKKYIAKLIKTSHNYRRCKSNYKKRMWKRLNHRYGFKILQLLEECVKKSKSLDPYKAYQLVELVRNIVALYFIRRVVIEIDLNPKKEHHEESSIPLSSLTNPDNLFSPMSFEDVDVMMKRYMEEYGLGYVTIKDAIPLANSMFSYPVPKDNMYYLRIDPKKYSS